MTDDEKKQLRKWHDAMQTAYLLSKDWEEAKPTWIAVMKEMQEAMK